MNRRGPRLFLLMAAVNVGLALVVDGLTRVACICGALTCLFAYLNRSTTKEK